MQEEVLRSDTATIDIYIKLAQYPILSDRIRERMREEIFRRGIISEENFEAEVEQRAIDSQRREGLLDPYSEEPQNLWLRRKRRIRALHTDFYFAYNLPSELFTSIVQEVIGEQTTARDRYYDLAFNPEVAPWKLLFEQGEIYEQLPPPQREEVAHHLEEIKVVLIKGMISDQLPYIAVAKKVFNTSDLHHIYQRRIGDGKIGGKSAGIALAWRILQQRDPERGPDISDRVAFPESYYLGTDIIYDFRRLNKMDHVMNQKYRSLEEIRADYASIVQSHLAGKFPPAIEEQIRDMMRALGDSPLIVRSSSLLEDNFGFSFAGKYHSYFCPNQGTEEENLAAVLDAIRLIYASTLNPDAILYRQRHNLIDYDERMAILIQPVRGHRYGRYYFPTLAGVGFSQNPFRWNAKIRREDGFLRLVWGLGTRAVDRVSSDYPRMISLSHPQLRPESSASAIRRYSQHYIDLIDLEANEFKSLPIHEVLTPDYPYARYIASLHRGDYIQEIFSTGSIEKPAEMVLTFNTLVHDQRFVKLLRTALMRLEEVYGTPVDIEFTVDVIPNYPEPDYRLHVLQCRPLSQRAAAEPVTIPEGLPEEQMLFKTVGLIPDGEVEDIRYIVLVDPAGYRRLVDPAKRLEVGRAVGRLNKRLEKERFILMGPGRWGSSNIELGVRVGYADIYNTAVLIEMSVEDDEHGIGELSYGTHFFQDLVEGGIHSLPLHLENPESSFNWDFVSSAPNALERISPEDAGLASCLKVIDLATQRLTILMDGSADKAVAFLRESGHYADNLNASLSRF